MMEGTASPPHTRQRLVMFGGATFFCIAAAINEWTAVRFLASDGSLSQLSVAVLRIFDAMVVIGAVALVVFRARIARALTWRNAAVCAVGVIVGFVVLEVGSFVLFRQLSGARASGAAAMLEDNLYLWQTGDTSPLPFAIKPNFEQVFRSLDGQFTTTIHTNNVGMRGSVPYNDAHADIGCIGDSFTFGFGVQDTETYCDHLRERFIGTRVLNYGFAGFTTPHYAMYLQHFPERVPDTLILTVYPDNDFTFDMDDTIVHRNRDGVLESVALSRRYANPDGSLGVRQVYETTNTFALKKIIDATYTGKWLYRAWFRLTVWATRPPIGTPEDTAIAVAPRVEPPAAVPTAEPPVTVSTAKPQVIKERRAPAPPTVATQEPSSSTPLRDGERTGLEYIGEIHRLMRSRGGRLIVLLIPTSADVRTKTPSPHWQQYAAWLGSQQIETIDPSATFVANETSEQSAYFPGDGHWTAFGHRLAADMITEYLGVHPSRVTP